MFTKQIERAPPQIWPYSYKMTEIKIEKMKQTISADEISPFLPGKQPRCWENYNITLKYKFKILKHLECEGKTLSEDQVSFDHNVEQIVIDKQRIQRT